MVKPGYKQTEIGVIPEDWDIKSLQDIVVSPLSYGVNAPAVPYDSNLYRYIRITDITEDGHYSKEDEVSVNILDGENTACVRETFCWLGQAQVREKLICTAHKMEN